MGSKAYGEPLHRYVHRLPTRIARQVYSTEDVIRTASPLLHPVCSVAEIASSKTPDMVGLKHKTPVSPGDHGGSEVFQVPWNSTASIRR